MTYNEIEEILKEQQRQLSTEAILRWGAYNIENYAKLFTSFYIEPSIKNVRDGNTVSGIDIEKLIFNMNKGNVLLLTGSAGSGKSCFLKRCFIKGFEKRKRKVIIFWLSASLINEGRPKNQQSFYRKIIKNKYTSKNKVIIFIDGADEIFNNEKRNLIKFIDELLEQKVSVVVGCRKNYYNRFLLEYGFSYVLEIQEWDKEQANCYSQKYLKSRGREYLFREIIKDNETIRKFMVNPFQITLLLYLIGNETSQHLEEISNVYMLYQSFYTEWIFKEKNRNSCFINEKDIEDVHYRIAKEFYKNFNKSVNISSVLTKRQKELECDKDETILSIVRLREQSMVGKYIADGFLHESFCEFFIAHNMINSLLCGGIKLFNSFLLVYRHFNQDFLEEGIANLPIKDMRKIRNNLEKAYVSLMPEEFINTHGNEIGVDKNIRKKYEHATKQQVDIIRDQCLFYLGKLPNEIISDSRIFELGYYHDSNILVKISAATVVINHGLDFSIEKDFIINLLNNELWEKTLRSWVLVFWEDVIYDNPYVYEDRGGNWSRVKRKRLGRIKMQDNELNLKYMRTRAIDLTQLYIFFRNRGWNTMTEEEYSAVCECNCDLGLYSNEKKQLLLYLKDLFIKAWNNNKQPKEVVKYETKS